MNNARRESCKIRELAVCLAEVSERPLKLKALFEHYCNKLEKLELPVDRASLGLELLHPNITGWQYIWNSQSSTSTSLECPISSNVDYTNSPALQVSLAGQPIRYPLISKQCELPMLERLRKDGATDYYIVPLPFLDRCRTAFISYATHRTNGFRQEQLIDLHLATILISPWIERHVLRRISKDILEVYVGRRSGAQVYEGVIKRGAAEVVDAVIFFADLRDFTKRSNSQNLPTVLEDLNQWLELLVAAVVNNGGEVLKFVGDGILAMFPVGEEGLENASQSALLACREALSTVSNLNVQRENLGQQKMFFVMGLDAGEVAYGNVGGIERLDFTAIGRTVNRASRLVDLAKDLEITVAISSTCAGNLSCELSHVGSHFLRGFDEAIEVYSL